jgi:bacteriorhodopsin
MYLSTLVCWIAAYHYYRIFQSWQDAYVVGTGENAGLYLPSGTLFNDAYRYADWLLTVPLLLAELVLVLALARSVTNNLLFKLITAAVLMLVLGYPGEVSTDNGTRWLWGTLSSIPFVYILYVLWVELTKALDKQPERVKLLTRNMRLLLLASWGFYPIAYLIPTLGVGEAVGIVGLQVGYSLADLLAKPVFGFLLYAIAREKTLADNPKFDEERVAAISRS